MIEARKNIDRLKQRLELIEASRERQTSAINGLKNENQNLRDELKRDRNKLSEVCMRKEELEYMLYNSLDSYNVSSESSLLYQACDDPDNGLPVVAVNHHLNNNVNRYSRNSAHLQLPSN